jgi:hypothetical protein
MAVRVALAAPCSTWNAHSATNPFHVKRLGRRDP